MTRVREEYRRLQIKIISKEEKSHKEYRPGKKNKTRTEFKMEGSILKWMRLLISFEGSYRNEIIEV